MSLRKTTNKKIKNKWGVSTNIRNTVFIRNNRRPSGGWGVKFEINDVLYESDGRSANASVASIAHELDKNNVPLNIESIWLSCNIHWVKNVPEGMRMISVKKLEESGVEFNAESVLDQSKKPDAVLPEVWGSVAWESIHFCLGCDTWKLELKLLTDIVANWLNPKKNPSRGCITCFEHYMENLREFRSKSRSQSEAKRWWIDFHNEVNERIGKPKFNWEDAIVKYHY